MGEAMQEHNGSAVWYALAFPPLLFLALIVSVSIWMTATTGGRGQDISARVTALVPHILVVAELVIAAALFAALRAEGLRWSDIGWRLAAGRSMAQDVGLGIMLGGSLGFLYVFALAPLLAFVQQSVGDFVPPGETLATVSSAIRLFFVANVMLAPFVEESLYRGYAIVRLSERMSSLRAAIVSCIFFGLLHWAGGIWYILLTGSVAGGVLVAIRLWSDSLIAPFMVHLTLNIVEFVFAWSRH
jgi:membrane protease YdiL (CAAX protease family)